MGGGLFAVDKVVINQKSDNVSRCSWRLEVNKKRKGVFLPIIEYRCRDMGGMLTDSG